MCSFTEFPPAVFEMKHGKDFSIDSSGSHFVQQSDMNN
jgi:hypothetical protein